VYIVVTAPVAITHFVVVSSTRIYTHVALLLILLPADWITVLVDVAYVVPRGTSRRASAC
jgi:hypothetical protein